MLLEDVVAFHYGEDAASENGCGMMRKKVTIHEMGSHKMCVSPDGFFANETHLKREQKKTSYLYAVKGRLGMGGMPSSFVLSSSVVGFVDMVFLQMISKLDLRSCCCGIAINCIYAASLSSSPDERRR